MSKKLSCSIPQITKSYDIEIGIGLLDSQAKYLATVGSKFAIITDDHVAPLYGEPLKQNLTSFGLQASLFSFPHGEQSKTRATKEILENGLFGKKFGRDTCVIALGGGVVTDLAGYLAATFCRGIPFVSIPTSLLGMADAGIGGKTGVNVPFGKNLLGCVYQPKKVIIDISTLKTLPRREYVNGTVEMIKHGIIADGHLFEKLENNCTQLLSLDPSLLEEVIFENCRIKKKIVEQDEKEVGIRHLLNFGHTVAHALERLTDYKLSHGEAVAIGIVVESYLSLKLGTLTQPAFDRIKAILLRYGLPFKLPSRFSVTTIQEAMRVDKKSLKGFPRFVMIDGIGSSLSCDSQYCSHVDESLLKDALQWMIDDLCRY